MTDAIRDQTGMGLGAAKAITDAVLRGEAACIRVPDWNTAVHLAEALDALGAEARPAALTAGEPVAAPDAPRR